MPSSDLHLFLAPCQQRRSVVAKGIERARGLVALAEPKPGVTVKRPEVSPDAVFQPAGVLYQALVLHVLQHRHAALYHRIVGGEDSSWKERVQESPLRLLGRGRSE